MLASGVLGLTWMLLTRMGSEQPPSLVATGSSLPVEARLRTMVLQTTVQLPTPAALLSLTYHPEEGWTSALRVPRTGPPLRPAGSHILNFPRRLGRLGPMVPDAGPGCAALGGVHNAATGFCGFGGSASVGPVLPDLMVGPSDYRAAVIRLDRPVSAAEVTAALTAARGQGAAASLQELARRWAGLDGPCAWVLLRVPRAADWDVP